MSERADTLARYRTGYLKMRSVLYDRVTGLPALPLMFDRLRTLLDDRRQVGVIHLELVNLDLVESIYGWQVFGVQLNYRWAIDLLLAGVVGYGAYFWFSGRVWCRFACPLAALMHIYTRLFSRFAIIPEKK